MYLSSSTKYFVMYLGTSTSTFLKLKYKVQASTRNNVLKYRQVQVPMYLAQPCVSGHEVSPSGWRQHGNHDVAPRPGPIQEQRKTG